MAAKEASALGEHVTFAPMLDLVHDALWGRVMESTGEDPYLNSVLAECFVKSFQGDFNAIREMMNHGYCATIEECDEKS